MKNWKDTKKKKRNKSESKCEKNSKLAEISALSLAEPHFNLEKMKSLCQNFPTKNP